ncbi:MAG: YhdH/YhfP family quinone oxidoreductase [Halioglobus sp.]|nr:YhdH/YhfP family quinone oxidoreductase [Halioglobus sp.]
MTTYRAHYIEEQGEGNFQQSIAQRDIDDLPAGDLLIRVHYSSLNFKDAMSANGNRGVTREFPHQGGIDAAGVVEESSHADFKAGDEVIVTGYDLGMNTAGGLAEYIRVPADWAIPCPGGLTPRGSMLFGTAGLTAQLCINKLQRMGVAPDHGEVLVTGATGGVGSLAVALLANAGYTVAASSGKADQSALLMEIGASEVIDRAEFSEPNKRPMLKERFAGAVDVVGGDTLANVIKQLKAGGSVACCGLVQSPAFDATVLPFRLRGVNLLGVDSVEIPLQDKQAAWEQLAGCAELASVARINHEITLDEVPATLERLYAGAMTGHAIVNIAGA